MSKWISGILAVCLVVVSICILGGVFDDDADDDVEPVVFVNDPGSDDLVPDILGTDVPSDGGVPFVGYGGYGLSAQATGCI